MTSHLYTIHEAFQQSCLVLGPPVHPRQVSIQVLHTGEGVFSRGAAQHPTIKWPLPIWILSTHPLCSLMLFLTANTLAQWGQRKLLSPSGASAPCFTLKCCLMPCLEEKDRSQSLQETLFPCTQAATCALSIFLLAKILPYFSQGNFSPLCTPIWCISLW